MVTDGVCDFGIVNAVLRPREDRACLRVKKRRAAPFRLGDRNAGFLADFLHLGDGNVLRAVVQKARGFGLLHIRSIALRERGSREGDAHGVDKARIFQLLLDLPVQIQSVLVFHT